MKTIYYLFPITILFFIISSCNETGKFKETITPTVIKDKQDIADAFIENVEYYRKFCYYGQKMDSAKYSKHPYSQGDPGICFDPYATRYNLEINNYVNSPLPTATQITPHVVNIVYSPDSLKCVAFICIKSHYDNIPSLEPARDRFRKYDGKVIMGIRDSINQQFKIYPYIRLATVGFENINSSMKILKYHFFKELKGFTAHNEPRFEGATYTHNLDEPEFFDTAPDFQKNKSEKFKDYYNCQLYWTAGWIIHPYQYYSNQPDSIKKKWDEGIDGWVKPED